MRETVRRRPRWRRKRRSRNPCAGPGPNSLAFSRKAAGNEGKWSGLQPNGAGVKASTTARATRTTTTLTTTTSTTTASTRALDGGGVDSIKYPRNWSIDLLALAALAVAPGRPRVAPPPRSLRSPADKLAADMPCDTTPPPQPSPRPSRAGLSRRFYQWRPQERALPRPRRN